MTRFLGYIDEAKKESEKEDKPKAIPPEEGKPGRTEKGDPDFTGTGIDPEKGHKTPEQIAQDDEMAAAQQANQEEDAIAKKEEELEKRDELIHGKFGRILATPDELKELDKERDEKEKHDKEREKLIKKGDETDIKESRFANFLDEGKSVQTFANIAAVAQEVRDPKKIKDNSTYKLNGVEMPGKKVREMLIGFQKERGITPEEGNDEKPNKDTSAPKGIKKVLQPPMNKVKIDKIAQANFDKTKEKKIKEEQAEKDVELNKLKNNVGKKKSIGTYSTDVIDGDFKTKALDGLVKAPGNLSSKINEIGIGYCLDEIIKKKGKMSVSEMYNFLNDKMKNTKAGMDNGPDKTENACLGAAISAVAEHKRLERICKENKLKISDCEVSHVWGSEQSLKGTCDYLDDNNIEMVNGIDKETYKKIIMDGGKGENPTDTMIVIKPKKGHTAIILHTSNKTSSNDIQGNSSTEKNLEHILEMIKKDKNIKNKPQIEKMCNDLIKKCAAKQKEITELITNQLTGLQKKAKSKAGSKEEKDLMDAINSLSGTGGNKYKKVLLKNTGYKGKDVVENDGMLFINGKKATNEDFKQGFVKLIDKVKIFQSIPDDNRTKEDALTGDEQQIFIRLAPPPEDELRALYADQHKMMNVFKTALNKETNGKGNAYFSEHFIHRLHGDGGDKGGVPNNRFEVNMGHNDSGIRYDPDTNEPYTYIDSGKKKGYYKCDENGNIIDETNKRTATSLTPGFDATLINDKTLSMALGFDPPPSKDFYKSITVSDVEYSKDSVSGVATIYAMNKGGKKVIIGYQTIRPKAGAGSKLQDTIQFHKDMQKLLQLASHKQLSSGSKKQSESFDLYNKHFSYMLNEDYDIFKESNIKKFFDTYIIEEDDE